MHLPAIPINAQSYEACIEFYAERLSANDAFWPSASVFLTAYLAWPSDEERRNSFVATCLTRFTCPSDADANKRAAGSSKNLSLEMFGGIGALAKPAFDQLAAEIRLPGHSQLRGAWSEFRDVAHLLAAGAYLAREALARAGSADESSILNAVWIAPDVVLAFAYGLQEFGLQPKSVRKESPILRPNTLWRVPDDHKLKKPFVAFRRLSDTQLEFLNSRRVGKKVA
jgi:hypothetical protein